MASASVAADAPAAPLHSSAFRTRRFLNWFPMGLTYAFLYMGRYNLTVAKNALGDLMTKDDFSTIFSIGTVVYALGFLPNGPLTDRFGGKRSLLTAAFGSGLANLAMGFYLHQALSSGSIASDQLRTVFSLLYAINMYFQSFGAVAIVKVNAPWFHVRERGSFSGIFGTMISSGIFFAFTVNARLLDLFSAGLTGADKTLQTRWLFLIPSAVLLTMGAIESVLLRDKPSDAGLEDFDTGDASSGSSDEPVPLGTLLWRILTHPVIFVVACIEFCTGVLRNGVMHWYPIYTKEVLALPGDHYLVNGVWSWSLVVPCFVGAAALLGVSAALGRRAVGEGVKAEAARSGSSLRGVLMSLGGLLFLVPFMLAGWGGIQMVAGVVGGIVAGYVSDLFFQSRRAPAAGGLYAVLFVCTIAMAFALGRSTNVLSASSVPELRPGDRIVSVAGQPTPDWVAARRAFACVPVACAQGARWDRERCTCSSSGEAVATPARAEIPVTVERDGASVELTVKDPAYKVAPDGAVAPRMRAGDSRDLKASPSLSLSPYVLGAIVFIVSMCVIGTHGMLSGTATMDFGGKKGAGTAVGMIDGFVYLGTALQSVSLGKITSVNWSWWPWFLAPFALLGFLLTLRIWNARPSRGR